MIAYKNITRIVGMLMASAVLFCIWAMAYSEDLAETFGGSVVTVQYVLELFDTDEIIRIDIQMPEEDWDDMISQAMSEEYYSCDIVINDRKISNVGIRPKGNTSLSSIAMDPETDRFSLKLEFDHYVEGQTCFGLDKLILNNNYADATNMKEALVYDMYQYLGADASLYNYAEISVNGEYWGVYLALEAVEESFLLRNYGTENGKLYKPESMGMGEGPGKEGHPGREGDGKPFGDRLEHAENAGDQAESKRPEPAENMPGMPGSGNKVPDGEDIREMPEGNPAPGEGGGLPDGGKMPGGDSFMAGKGADLNYTDDELDSYATIWEGEVSDTGKSDHQRVVRALKNIREGTDLEEYLDIDNILKYMAVHVFSVNMDSLSGNMAHNYYLYEYDGRLNILPWDYNLSFGGMGMGSPDGGALEMINDAIDTPFQGTEFFDALLEDEEYLSRYHAYLQQLAEEYVFGGKFEETYDRIRMQIDELAETDPTAFYSYEEYEAGADMLYKTIMLRAESIQGQLNGTISSTDEGQRADSSGFIDASDIDIDVMGTFDMGREDKGMARK